VISGSGNYDRRTLADMVEAASPRLAKTDTLTPAGIIHLVTS
jgi:hypothetical protein